MRSPLFVVSAFASFAAAFPALVGCVAPSDERPDAEAVSATATAVVSVEHWSDTTRGDAIVARFVRTRTGAVDEAALRIAGATSDLPALGTCTTAQESEPSLQPRSVDLLDVGALTVERALGKTLTLLPRAMPDPTGVVSGVFYSARASEVSAPSTRLQLNASGGPDKAEGFHVDVPYPRDLEGVRVVSSGGGFELSWQPDLASSDVHDIVYVDVLGAASRLVARCTSTDSGQLLVPAASLGPAFGADEGQLAVHRIHRESFRAKGIEPGEVRFDVARIVAVRR